MVYTNVKKRFTQNSSKSDLHKQDYILKSIKSMKLASHALMYKSKNVNQNLLYRYIKYIKYLHRHDSTSYPQKYRYYLK